MKKNFINVVILLLPLIGLSGCGGNSGPKTNDASTPPVGAKPSELAPDDNKSETKAAKDGTPGTPGPGTPDTPGPGTPGPGEGTPLGLKSLDEIKALIDGCSEEEDKGTKDITKNERRAIFALYHSMSSLKENEKKEVAKHIYSRKGKDVYKTYGPTPNNNKCRMARLMFVAKVAGNMGDDWVIGASARSQGVFNLFGIKGPRLLGAFILGHANQITTTLLEKYIHNPDNDDEVILVTKEGDKYVIKRCKRQEIYADIEKEIKEDDIAKASKKFRKLDSEQRENMARLRENDIPLLREFVKLDSKIGKIVLNNNVTVNDVINPKKAYKNMRGMVLKGESDPNDLFEKFLELDSEHKKKIASLLYKKDAGLLQKFVALDPNIGEIVVNKNVTVNDVINPKKAYENMRGMVLKGESDTNELLEKFLELDPEHKKKMASLLCQKDAGLLQKFVALDPNIGEIVVDTRPGRKIKKRKKNVTVNDLLAAKAK